MGFNIADIIIIAAVALIVILAVRKIIRNKKSGRYTCGCDCGSCGSSCGNLTKREESSPKA